MIVSGLILNGCFDGRSYSIEEGFVTSKDGVNLFYQKIGEGASVFIVPAGIYLADEFKRLARKERTILFYDQRGRGRSDVIKDKIKLKFQNEISDLESIREHFNYDKISLIGWSYSGAIVALYACEYPSHVKRVIQISPIPPRKEKYWDQFIRTLSTRYDSTDLYNINKIHEQHQNSTKTQEYIKKYYSIAHKAHFYKEVIENRFRKDFYTLKNERPDNVWSFVLPSIIESFGDWDFRSNLKNLEVPFLIIHGSHDAIPFEGCKEWAHSLSDGRIIEISEAGHFPWLEKPDIFFRAVDEFLLGRLPGTQ